MRQDVAYYLCYIHLRPGHEWKLISYPYYAKFTQPGALVPAIHIKLDLNLVHDAPTCGITYIPGEGNAIDTKRDRAK